MSQYARPKALIGATLIDGTGTPPLKDSIVILEDKYIVEVGKRGQVKVPPDAEIIDLKGKTITPGLIDSHCHFLWMGIAMKSMVLLNEAKTMGEALNLLKERVENTEPGEWIIGLGWDESKWPEKRYLTKHDIDPVAPNNPVMLSRVCGHLISVNSKALEVAGITPETQSAAGGSIDKDEAGELTGILRDCRDLIESHIPPVSVETMVDGLELASRLALSLGCTGVHDAGLSSREIEAYHRAEREGKLKVRSTLMLRGDAAADAVEKGVNRKGELVRLGPVKLFVDGSLGARTAALFEPYEDDPTTRGLLLETRETLTEKIWRAHEAGLQTASHAIGDLAIDIVLDSIQEALRRFPRKDHRHRIEHCEITSVQQIERIKQLGIITDMQPNFIGEWGGLGGMYNQRLGDSRERMSNQYRAMLDEGIRVAFGSDGMPFNPVYGIWSAVNHTMRESRVTLEEAVMCYTLNAAYAGFQEDMVGSIEKGKLGDIAVFDRDLSEIPWDEIREAECYMTLVGGEILYKRDEQT